MLPETSRILPSLTARTSIPPSFAMNLSPPPRPRDPLPSPLPLPNPDRSPGRSPKPASNSGTWIETNPPVGADLDGPSIPRNVRR